MKSLRENKRLLSSRVEPIHSQKSHNLLNLLKSINRSTPIKGKRKNSFNSQPSISEPFNYVVKNSSKFEVSI